MRVNSARPLLACQGLATLAAAWASPGYAGYSLQWESTFASAAGQPPSPEHWNIITGYLGVNAEWEKYTSSPANVQCSGGQTLQLVPWRDASTAFGWTSGRIESRYTFTPKAGAVTRAEALIRFGGNAIANKQGIWPAFWLLGQSLRQGGGWPACGELDIMETVNGALRGYGTAHCGTYPGGPCNEGTGIGGSVGVPDQGWHTWRIEWDRSRPGGWASETITWYMDGQAFHQIRGGQLTQDIWSALAHSGLYFVLNVAVGGTWPGYPNGATWDGYGSMMEVAYVAHLVTV